MVKVKAAFAANKKLSFVGAMKAKKSQKDLISSKLPEFFYNTLTKNSCSIDSTS